MSLSNSMVAHTWAHGQAGKGSNFETDGKRLISYSTDVAYNTGRGLVFISADSMSPSTGRQLSHARSACSHLDVVSTPMFEYGSRLYDFDEKRAFKMACDALSVTLEGYDKAKLGKYLHDNIGRAYDRAGELVTIAIRYGFEIPAFYTVSSEKRAAAATYAEQWEVRDAARREAARGKATARAAAQREHDAEQFNMWRLGLERCPNSYRTNEQGGFYIAVHGDKVVTSGGAECPRLHAERAIEFWWLRMADFGSYKPWHRNGHTVQLGVFQLDRIEADGTAYAGCHKFTPDELNRLADILL